MNFYNVNSSIYRLLSKSVQNIQSLKVIDTSSDDSYRYSYQRLEESKFVISEDIKRVEKTVVTAHNINEYRPSTLRIEKLMQDNNVLLIDLLIQGLEEVRNVPIQSN